MRVGRYIVLIPLLIAAIHVPSALAQTTPDLEEGMKPYGDFHGGDIDQISLSTGKLVLNIPLISYPQRGGKIKVAFSVRWQNITPRQTEVFYPNTETYVERAYRDASSSATGQPDFMDALEWTQGPGGATSPDQSLHQLITPDSGATWRSIDATGIIYTSANTTLQTSDGLRYVYGAGGGPGLTKVEDPNGNFVTATTNSTGAAMAWTDTLGRNIPTPLSATSTTDFSHCTGANPISSATTWTVPGPNGGSDTFKFCYA